MGMCERAEGLRVAVQPCIQSALQTIAAVHTWAVLEACIAKRIPHARTFKTILESRGGGEEG